MLVKQTVIYSQGNWKRM